MKQALISLHRGYGLGDGVQMSAVLRHVAHYRPDWRISYRAEEGRHQVGRGIVHRHFAYGEEPDDLRYDFEVLICLYDTWANWYDRPNTRVSFALHEYFDLPWDSELGRYVVNVRRETLQEHKVPLRSVAVHYLGDSDKIRKDLTFEQYVAITTHILKLGYTPFTLGRHTRQGWDAEVNCALISQCAAFVGIDSGPGKCASATETPTLITWTGHHPAPFHDPAPNTTHLVPQGYHGLEPVCNNAGVIKWFESHHSVIKYEGDPVKEIKTWLTRLLS
jgi:hypothetical protein